MKKISLLLVLAMTSFSCNDDDNSGDFNNSKILGFSSSFQTVSYFEDQGVVDKQFPIDLYGSGTATSNTKDIYVSYSVDPSSTAVEGQEYSFTNDSKKVLISAGKTFGMLPIKVNTGQLNSTQKTELVLNLTEVDQDGFIISDQQKQMKVVFVGCRSELEGTYTVVVVRNDGITRTYFNENINLISVNYFQTTTTGPYSPGSYAPLNQGFFFTDICGDITVLPQQLFDYYPNVVKGITTNGTDGHVDDINHFSITYEISFAAGNRLHTNTYTRNN